MLTMSSFYNYVFGHHLVITNDIYISPLSLSIGWKALSKQYNLTDRTPEAEKFVIEKLREEARNNKQERIKKDFENITKNSAVSLRFHSFLQSIEAINLDQTLYGGYDAKDLATKKQIFPSDKNIEELFFSLDHQYQYFTKDKTAKEKFLVLFKAAKLMADFVELNNTDDDSVAATYAYKMMVLFGASIQNPLSFTENFLKTHANDKTIHDTLMSSIPVNNPAIKHYQWQQLIQTKGCQAISYFQRAAAIEKKLSRAPVSLEEAQNTAAQLSYARCKENPELAALCQEYNLEESVFNRCLSVKLKNSDKLPKISIDGAKVNMTCHGYHWVKLPLKDPRNFIIGKLTDCCQSMGGHSEQCVIDSLTYEYNGVYVLLKAKKSDETDPPFLENGEINYAKYKLVGESYTWLSEENNLVLDSIEILQSVPESVVISMLTQFAKEATAEQAHHSLSPIFRVTFGDGEKTPDTLSNIKILKNPEIMIEGYEYRDAKEQRLLWKNEDMAAKYARILEQNIYHAHKFKINFLKLNSVKHAERIAILFLDEQNIQYYKEKLGNHYDQFVINSMNPELCKIYFILHEAKILTADIYLWVEDGEYIHDVCVALSTVAKLKSSLITPKLLRRLVQASEHANKFREGISHLYNKEGCGATLLTDDHINLLLQHVEHAEKLARVITKLYKVDPKLINPEFCKILDKHAQHAKEIGDGIYNLRNVEIKLITPEILQLLIDNETWADNFATFLCQTYKIIPEFFTPENISLLKQHGKFVYNILYPLKDFYQNLPNTYTKLAAEENFKSLLINAYTKFLIDQGKRLTELEFCFEKSNNSYFGTMTYCFKRFLLLYEINPQFATPQNFQALIHPDADKIVAGMKYNPELTSEEQCQLLMNNPKYADKLGRLLSDFTLVSEELVSAENIKLLLQNVEYLEKLIYGIAALYSVYYKVATKENLQVLITHMKHACPLGRGMSILYAASAELLNTENINFLIPHAEYARELSTALSKLYTVNSALVYDVSNRKLLAENAANAVSIADSIIEKEQVTHLPKLSMSKDAFVNNPSGLTIETNLSKTQESDTKILTLIN